MPNKNYNDIYKRSIEDPEGFWSEAAELITWYKKWRYRNGFN